MAKYGINTESLLNDKSEMLSQPTCKSACQFVYRGSLGAICRAQNNKTSIFSPLGRKPVIQKVPKYGTRNLHMLYKILCPYFIKVHVYCVLLVCQKTFISVSPPKWTKFVLCLNSAISICNINNLVLKIMFFYMLYSWQGLPSINNGKFEPSNPRFHLWMCISRKFECYLEDMEQWKCNV